MKQEDIIELHERIETILQRFKEDKNYAFDCDIDTFCLYAKFLNPQSYGNRVQCYFANLMDYQIIPSSLDKGDFINKYNEIVEFKCSFLTKFSRDINIKQIRTWQTDIKYYYIFAVDFLDYKNIRYKTYKLTKKEMLQECALLKATPCHSTKEANKVNTNVEIGFSIKFGSLNFKRWESLYLLNDFDIKSLSIQKVDKDLEIKQLKEEIVRLRQLSLL